MPTFAELPFEMRIEIFAQLTTSEDAAAFRRLDRTNYQIITERLYEKHGFLTPKELDLLATLGRNKVIRELTSQVFSRMYIATFPGHEMDRSPRLRKESTMRRVLRNGNKTEYDKRRAMQLLRWLSHAEMKACDDITFQLEKYIIGKEYVESLLEKTAYHLTRQRRC
ncbi:hypothetical protein BJ508DRAFT_314547 [Ascobolus immersus RN42]|uniref:F-box domain-containing protein n=1 Tax=Ascobolus immersus RN42 TaxID=1160509 RepID=A0A3N4HJ89_ASCIM|nr:hypothetical protein BJ508DRAFT_314547 [Ascobolus immersus RN42]